MRPAPWLPSMAVCVLVLLRVSSAQVPATSNHTATFVSLREFPAAKCLDGSSTGYFVRRALSPDHADSWLFVLEGGGVCTTQADCIARANGTELGSSTAWPKTLDLNQTDLTTSDPRNPFALWNMVWLKYCDGSMHTGSRTSASVDTFGLWFSGHHTIAAALMHLARTTALNSTSKYMCTIFSALLAVCSRRPVRVRHFPTASADLLVSEWVLSPRRRRRASGVLWRKRWGCRCLQQLRVPTALTTGLV